MDAPFLQCASRRCLVGVTLLPGETNPRLGCGYDTRAACDSATISAPRRYYSRVCQRCNHGWPGLRILVRSADRLERLNDFLELGHGNARGGKTVVTPEDWMNKWIFRFLADHVRVARPV